MSVSLGKHESVCEYTRECVSVQRSRGVNVSTRERVNVRMGMYAWMSVYVTEHARV